MNKELKSWIKPWKPNLFQRFLYWAELRKDPRYNGVKKDYSHLDEIAHTQQSNYWSKARTAFIQGNKELEVYFKEPQDKRKK